jgi:hypothetical protein
MTALFGCCALQRPSNWKPVIVPTDPGSEKGNVGEGEPISQVASKEGPTASADRRRSVSRRVRLRGQVRLRPHIRSAIVDLSCGMAKVSCKRYGRNFKYLVAGPVLLQLAILGLSCFNAMLRVAVVKK